MAAGYARDLYSTGDTGPIQKCVKDPRILRLVLENMAANEIDAFQDILTLLQSMEKKRAVDNSILGKIDFLAHAFSMSEQFWLRDKTVPPVDAFVMFHAYRNAHSILKEARSRFDLAAKKHDNPKVVDDAMIVFPPVFKLFTTVKTLEGRPLTPGLRSLVFAHIRSLRSAAAQASMLPTNGDSGVDPLKVNEEANSLAESLPGILSER